jgi:hypothetical protein
MPTARREGTVSPAGGHAGATEMAIESNGIIVSETGTISPGAAEPLYVEIYDGSLREYLGGMFSEETMATRFVSQVVALPDGKWLIKLSHDQLKVMKATLKP